MTDAAPGVPGRVYIESAVVEKIVEKAIEAIDGVELVERDGFRRLWASSRPIRARVGRSTASVTVDLRLRYPEPVATMADRVRRAIREDVQKFGDREVSEVNVFVTGLDPAPLEQG